MRKTIQVKFLHNSTLQAREIITQRTTITSMMDFRHTSFVFIVNHTTQNIFYLSGNYAKIKSLNLNCYFLFIENNIYVSQK